MENVCKEEDEGDNENKLKAILFYQFEDIPKQVSKVSASFLFLSLFFSFLARVRVNNVLYTWSLLARLKMN